MSSQEAGDVAGMTGGQMLTFQLGGETYGVDILRVKEIRGWSAVTRIPKSPKHVLGVLNLRGAVVPIIDLRVRFSLDSADFSPMTVIIVLSLVTEDGVRECGVVVDSVSDVVEVAAESLKPPPALSGAKQIDFISGLATVDDKMLILLNVNELLMQDLKPAAVTSAAA